MDRTEQTVRKTLAAIDAPCYDIGILTDRGMVILPPRNVSHS